MKKVHDKVIGVSSTVTKILPNLQGVKQYHSVDGYAPYLESIILELEMLKTAFLNSDIVLVKLKEDGTR